jgi:hypothetical protein
MATYVAPLPFSLDALVAEAKRRMRRRRLLLGVVALALATGAFVLRVELVPRGGGSVGDGPHTSLSIRFMSGGFGSNAVFRLTCDPAGGTVPQPAEACAAIAAQPTLITNPKAEAVSCYGGGTNITVVGRMNGTHVDAFFSTCWARGTALVRKLGLIPARG